MASEPMPSSWSRTSHTESIQVQAGNFPQISESFAKKAVQSQKAHDQFVVEQEQAAKAAEEEQETRTALEEEIWSVVEELRQAVQEKVALNAQLVKENAALTAQHVKEQAAATQFTDTRQPWLFSFAVVLAGLLGWIVKLRGEHTQLTRTLTRLTQENASLRESLFGEAEAFQPSFPASPRIARVVPAQRGIRIAMSPSLGQ